jgi:predicted DNA binding CopG/RHH family protein
MTQRKSRSDWLKESDEWDKKSLEELIAESEPTDIRFIDRRPKKAISLRVDEGLIEAGKRAAKEAGIGYQTLFRMWLVEGLRRHNRRAQEDDRSRRGTSTGDKAPSLPTRR